MSAPASAPASPRTVPVNPPVDEDLFVTPQRQAAAAVSLVLRLALWPLFLLRELLMLPRRLVWDEAPDGSPLVCTLVSSRLGLPPGPLQRALDAIDGLFIPGHPVYLRRFYECWRHSWMLGYHSVVYYLAVAVIEMVGLDTFLQQWKRPVMAAIAVLTGTGHRTLNGRLFPLSVLNVVDADFTLPYDVDDLFRHLEPAAPQLSRTNASSHRRHAAASKQHGEGDNGRRCWPQGKQPATINFEVRAVLMHSKGVQRPKHRKRHQHADSPRDAHLLAMCAKLEYEDLRIIADVLRRWGMELHSYRDLPAHLTRSQRYVPDVVWFIASTRHAVVLVFRGADPFFQVSRQADIPCAQARLDGAGNALEGFVRGLCHTPHAALGPGVTAYSRLLEELSPLLPDREPVQRRLVVTGHSVGAGLASTFVQQLYSQGSRLVRQLGAIVTFGQPRTGDAEYARSFDARFGDRAFRYVCGCDIVTELPNVHFANGYQHHGNLRLIISSPPRDPCFPPGLICCGETAEAEQKLEDEWGVFWALFKIRRGIQFAVHRREYEAMGTPYYRESWLRILSRMALAVVPGISDHFPGDYAAALRLAIFQRPAHGSDTEATP